jgi:DNA-binding MarR family transcriptional regulator
MSEIIKLVTEWDAFEKEHKGATVEDFCRYYLIKKRETGKENQLFGGHVPPESNGTLAKLIGRLASISVYYFKNIMKQEKDIDIDIEAFTLINVIHYRKECRKTDAIGESYLELSTGIDILTRLRKNGYISERGDPNDKRARLVRTTAKGEAMLVKCWRSLGKSSFFVYNDLGPDDKKIVMQLLSNLEIKHSKIISENRNKNLDELIEEFSDKKAYTAFWEQVKEGQKKYK